ncbi:P-loop containing nucleoside triphosphate hydrolase protein [Phyllosticta citricarpa]|uniref:P-loop containing nucleoside triphosphate hydrolase protein n=1 Tax=Phyllosticta citricarpa TaxID=55181 RepID=A0ABR1L795_9PEZI
MHHFQPQSFRGPRGGSRGRGQPVIYLPPDGPPSGFMSRYSRLNSMVDPSGASMPMRPLSNGDHINSATESLESSLIGMQAGIKHLYSGKEDKRGKFEWQDTLPDDLKEPVENAETAKWAIVARKIRVYNDPRKVLKLHSVVIQSPLLKKLLEKVLHGYPGVTVTLKRLEFGGLFMPLVHRWSELMTAIDELNPDSEDEDERTTREHSLLLKEVLETEFKDVVEATSDMRLNNVTTFEHLWMLFQPNDLIFCRLHGQDATLKMGTSHYGKDPCGNPFLAMNCKNVEWDGNRFGTSPKTMTIPSFSGTRKITDLPCYPVGFHQDQEVLHSKLLERGAKFEALAGTHYKAYQGMAWQENHLQKKKDKYNVKGRVMIDTYGWNQFVPDEAVFTAPLSSPGSEEIVEDDLGLDADGMPNGGDFLEEESREASRAPLTEEQKLMTSPIVRGYSLKNKQWLKFFVNSVKEIEWQEDAFESLVLPSNQKELILGFTDAQRRHIDAFDDVIEGKGRGIILLLCGPPGVGKTLTAESVAEEMQAPLVMMSASDLSIDHNLMGVEAKLQRILEMCTRWDAVLLLDEADIFLEERSLHELERNKLVTVFLRVLEYYEGIMFLTTNRVKTFDPAFQSRIHISIEYPELSMESRRKVWENFLAQSTRPHSIKDRELHMLSMMDMNGRQIKNVLKTAQLLAARREDDLDYQHIMQVLEVTQHLHNANMETERARSSIFC